MIPHIWNIIRGRVSIRIDPTHDDGPVDPVTLYWYEMGCPPELSCRVPR